MGRTARWVVSSALIMICTPAGRAQQQPRTPLSTAEIIAALTGEDCETCKRRDGAELQIVNRTGQSLAQVATDIRLRSRTQTRGFSIMRSRSGTSTGASKPASPVVRRATVKPRVALKTAPAPGSQPITPPKPTPTAQPPLMPAGGAGSVRLEDGQCVRDLVATTPDGRRFERKGFDICAGQPWEILPSDEVVSAAPAPDNK